MPKFVFVGDSLTQGFQSGAISRTEWSYPSMIARAFSVDDFRVPDFSGAGGLPANLERVIRRMKKYEPTLDFWEVVPALAEGYLELSAAESYWEKGDGTRSSGTGPIHHNLAVWGFSLSDAYLVTEGMCRRKIEGLSQHPDVDPTVAEGMYRTARRTLNPEFDPLQDDLTQLDLVQKMGEVEQVENLVFWLGANNVLGTALSLQLNWSQSADVHKLPHQRECNIWTVEHFQLLWNEVEARLLRLQQHDQVGRVFVGTVPNVTIPPIMRGVSPAARRERKHIDLANEDLSPLELSELYPSERSFDGLYEYYTHFWIWDEDFMADPSKHPHITRDEARQVQNAVLQYNAIIKASAEKHGWGLLDIAKLLDGLAFRRNSGDTDCLPEGLVKALTANPLTNHLVEDGRALIDTRYLGSVKKADASTEPQGGIFSLDGIHPTTVGYGIVADYVINEFNNAGVPGAAAATLDWESILANDSLISNRPLLLGDLQRLLGQLDPVIRRVLISLRDMSGRG